MIAAFFTLSFLLFTLSFILYPYPRLGQKEDPRLNEEPGIRFNTAATYSPTFAVPLALTGLTSLFGMGRGGTPSLLPP